MVDGICQQSVKLLKGKYQAHLSLPILKCWAYERNSGKTNSTGIDNEF